MNEYVITLKLSGKEAIALEAATKFYLSVVEKNSGLGSPDQALAKALHGIIPKINTGIKHESFQTSEKNKDPSKAYCGPFAAHHEHETDPSFYYYQGKTGN
jgi:hypothetical protein